MYPRIEHIDGQSAMLATVRTSARKQHLITDVLDGKCKVGDKALKLCRQFMNIHYPGWNKQKVN